MNKDNSQKVILDLCGGTGSWSKPYKDAGYDVRIITLPEYDILKWREYSDLMELIKSNRIYGILAAPPCTMFSFARNNKTAKEPRNLRKGMETVIACLDLIWECLYEPFKIEENKLKFWALENPRGYLRRFLGKPALEFDPFMYGDEYTKRTHIWGNFNIPKENRLDITNYKKEGRNFLSGEEEFLKQAEMKVPRGYREKLFEYLRNNGSSQGFADFQASTLRSVTPTGFAEQFFKSNQ